MCGAEAGRTGGAPRVSADELLRRADVCSQRRALHERAAEVSKVACGGEEATAAPIAHMLS